MPFKTSLHAGLAPLGKARSLFIALAAFRRGLLRIDRRDLPTSPLLGVIFSRFFQSPSTPGCGMSTHPAALLFYHAIVDALIARFVARERLSARQVGVLTSMVGVVRHG
jgi:hypothetical protein